ncbi:hypothetical protein QEH52_19950 [Coraliomargarita sp. SDUM461003]|uniref:Uncharacterized protein n=1 Tax=Thalassobacterium maritimum TaxID=3041265 RepID=A0ABU1B083_9BACT|nr:hypothetical protein [Coraliomargarita sp. SDUM461003]MDQ8209803.1 hypothetical protein [Coraliomargarita sp. SDUM461003]
MNRIKASLALVQILYCGGAILFYTTGSALGVLIGVLALFMRTIAPVPDKSKETEFGLYSFLGLIWVVTLITWLGDKGMHEVLALAFDERFTPLPFTLFVTFLLGMVIKEWMYLLDLSEAEIDQYYSKKTQP